MVPFSPLLRRMRWLYVGLASGAALLFLVLIRFPERGSIGPLAFGLQKMFNLTGAFDRVWYHWFDRNYGLAVYTPWVVLAFWAVVYYLPRLRRLRVGYTESASLAVLGYCLMFGLWSTNLGASVAGRYLCAAIPLMAILVALWCGQRGSLLNLRTALAAALLCISGAFVLVSIWVPMQPYRLFGGYTGIFQEYWALHWNDPDTGNSALPLGIALLSLVAVTKLAAIYRSRTAGGERARMASR
jgi:hypothetical protein